MERKRDLPYGPENHRAAPISLVRRRIFMYILRNVVGRAGRRPLYALEAYTHIGTLNPSLLRGARTSSRSLKKVQREFEEFEDKAAFRRSTSARG